MIMLAILIALSSPMAQAASLDERLALLVDRGDAEAAYHLGMLYNNGIGLVRDPAQALHWFRIAAEKGDPLGAYKLGCYYDGQGGSVLVADAASALRYKLIAARAGYSLAQDDVAAHYLSGGDRAAAMRWLEAAAAQGDATALLRIAILGTQTPPAVRPVFAYVALAELIHLAGRETSSEAKQQLDMLGGRLPPAERAAADRQVAAYKPVPTELTRKAFEGLVAARRLAGLN